MAVTYDNVLHARTAFRADQNNETAAMFLSKLHEAFENGETCEDDFHDGLHEVERYLWKGGSVVTVESEGA